MTPVAPLGTEGFALKRGAVVAQAAQAAERSGVGDAGVGIFGVHACTEGIKATEIFGLSCVGHLVPDRPARPSPGECAVYRDAVGAIPDAVVVTLKFVPKAA